MSPIGELNFSIATRTGRKFGKMTCFRPLSGSYISQCKRKTKGENHEQFPSPIGELHFSMVTITCANGNRFSVSVPYRGATFLNRLIPEHIITYFLFPSPIGELHFSIDGETLQDKLDGFRPLSGSYISQL